MSFFNPQASGVEDTAAVPSGTDAAPHCLPGVCIAGRSVPECEVSLSHFRNEWRRLSIDEHIESEVITDSESPMLKLSIAADFAAKLMPDHDTLGLAQALQLDTLNSEDDLLREIWLTLLHSPLSLQYPTAEELMAAVRMRKSIVQNSRLTCLNFHTSEIERPHDCWQYSEETGFVLLPSCALVDSLKKACQPEITGQNYSFSCSRATEYIILTAIAEEAERNHPQLLADLESQWKVKAIQAGRFRQAFVEEYGSVDQPLPIHYYIPGDRIWFRNPDEASFDAKGFEGSWVFYLGNGLFTNFWKLNQPFDLLHKCLEIYHWRHGTWRDEYGELQMDESIVEKRVAQTMADTTERDRVFALMHRIRDASGTFAEGGCMDATREAPRFVLAPHCDMIEQMNDWP